MNRKKIIIVSAIGITIFVVTAFLVYKSYYQNGNSNNVGQTLESNNTDKIGMYGAITPGLSPVDVKKLLGDPVEQNSVNNQTLYSYQSDYKAFPNQVYFRDDKTELVKEVVSKSDPRYGKSIHNILPFPLTDQPTIKIYLDYGDSNPLYIYPKDGVAFIAHVSDQTVSEIWHFQPTDMQTIMSTWGKDLLDKKQFDALESY